MADGDYVEGSWYFYSPNKGAAVFFLCAFLTSTMMHFWQCLRYKYWNLCGLFPVCGLLFSLGFALRSYGSFDHYDELVPFIVGICLIYASPPLLELANYHTLGRVLAYVPYISPINPSKVLSTFGFLSLIIEVLNGIGSSLVSNPTSSKAGLGKGMMQTSLALQFFVVVCFVSLAGYFHLRCAKEGMAGARGIKNLLITLYVSTLLILARTVYRAVEHFGIQDLKWTEIEDLSEVPAIVRYEWFFYVFEAGLMLVNMGMWNIKHPHRYIPANFKVYLERDGMTETEGQGWHDDRPFFMGLVDPLDLVGMIKRRNRPTGKYGELEDTLELRTQQAV